MDEFVIFMVIIVKMYRILVDYGGSVVLQNYMHAATHYVITELIVPFDESSNFNEADCKYRRCGRLSCLGRACKVSCMSTSFRVAIGEADPKPSGFFASIMRAFLLGGGSTKGDRGRG